MLKLSYKEKNCHLKILTAENILPGHEVHRPTFQEPKNTMYCPGFVCTV